MNQIQTGVVENVEYTSGSAGNQWTTISGVRYATWWNVMTRDWKVGDTVTFQSYEATLWSGQPKVPGAQNIRKAVLQETNP
jgi:hypothetical protein